MFNNKLAKVPGVNPIKFNNLEEYTEFVKWQRNQGIRCPVLFLQHSYDAQGESTYTARPSPFDLAGGLPQEIPKGLSNPPENKLVDAGRNDPLTIQETIQLLTLGTNILVKKFRLTRCFIRKINQDN